METKRNKAWRRFQENRVFKARMLKFAGWQIVVWDENGNCIERPHWFKIAKEKWAKKYKDCSTPCSCWLCRGEKYSRVQFKKIQNVFYLNPLSESNPLLKLQLKEDFDNSNTISKNKTNEKSNHSS